MKRIKPIRFRTDKYLKVAVFDDAIEICDGLGPSLIRPVQPMEQVLGDVVCFLDAHANSAPRDASREFSVGTCNGGGVLIMKMRDDHSLWICFASFVENERDWILDRRQCSDLRSKLHGIVRDWVILGQFPNLHKQRGRRSRLDADPEAITRNAHRITLN